MVKLIVEIYGKMSKSLAADELPCRMALSRGIATGTATEGTVALSIFREPVLREVFGNARY